MLIRYVTPALTVAAAMLVGTANAQEFPVRPIRIVTGLPGGGSDLTARILAQGMPNELGQNVIVENRPGSIIPPQIVSKAAPDGYTLLVFANLLWLSQYMEGNSVTYDAMRDFAPISMVSNAPNILVLHPSVPASSVKELIALAKAKPGALNCSTAASATSSHLALELFKAMTGTDIVRIPYKGNAPAVTDLIGGHVQLSFATPAVVTPFAKSGKLKVIAVTSLEPSALFPGLPTVASQGLPGYQSGTITGFFAPGKTPQTVIAKLNHATVRTLTAPDIKDKLVATGVDVTASTPAQLTAAMKNEMTRLGKVIKDNKIRDE